MIEASHIFQDEMPVDHEGNGLDGERPLIFPFRLHSLLSSSKQLGVDDIVSWNESGSKLVIFDLERFVSTVLPTVFRQSQFASFRRQMNAYGFEREMKSTKSRSCPAPTMVVYSHKHFHRENLAACAKIIRRNSKQQEDIPSGGKTLNRRTKKGVDKTKTGGLVDIPFMMESPKASMKNDESLTRMYERVMHNEVKKILDTDDMQSVTSETDELLTDFFEDQESISEPLNKDDAFKASDDVLDELAEMVSKTGGSVNIPFMMKTSKAFMTNDESLSRIFERTMYKEIRQQQNARDMRLNGMEKITTTYQENPSMYEDDLDELVETMSISDLSGCSDADGIRWDSRKEAPLSYVQSKYSRAA